MNKDTEKENDDISNSILNDLDDDEDFKKYIYYSQRIIMSRLKEIVKYIELGDKIKKKIEITKLSGYILMPYMDLLINSKNTDKEFAKNLYLIPAIVTMIKCISDSKEEEKEIIKELIEVLN